MAGHVPYADESRCVECERSLYADGKAGLKMKRGAPGINKAVPIRYWANTDRKPRLIATPKPE